MNSFVFDRFLKLICPCVYIRERNISDNDIKNSHFMYKKYNFDRVLYPFDNVVQLGEYFSKKKLIDYPNRPTPSGKIHTHNKTSYSMCTKRNSKLSRF